MLSAPASAPATAAAQDAIKRLQANPEKWGFVTRTLYTRHPKVVLAELAKLREEAAVLAQKANIATKTRLTHIRQLRLVLWAEVIAAYQTEHPEYASACAECARFLLTRCE